MWEAKIYGEWSLVFRIERYSYFHDMNKKFLTSKVICNEAHMKCMFEQMIAWILF